MHHHPEHVMYQQGHELYGQQQYVQHHNHTIQPEEYLYQQHQPTDIYQDHQQYQQNHIPYSPHEIIRTAPEDVLMMDIDDDTQLEAITNEISEWRTHFDYQLPMAGTEMEYMINSQSQLDYVHPTEWTFIIPDTNYFISHLNFLSKLIRTLNNIPKVILLVPTVVLKELDGLKSQSSLEWKARNAINLLYDAFRENVPCVRGQKLEEVLLEADERKMNNDDKILGCCRYFLQGTPRLLLLTDDKNLSVKAMVHSILSVSNYKQSVHHFMMDLAIHFQLQFPPAYIQIIQSEIENAAYNPPESKGRHAWETDGVIVEAKDDGVSLNPVLDPQAAPVPLDILFQQLR
ncbi:PIN domain-containing protein [Cladochytrium replicatum]|nr:PIN domain-containing protein [Cladochytrium replicatum]